MQIFSPLGVEGWAPGPLWLRLCDTALAIYRFSSCGRQR